MPRIRRRVVCTLGETIDTLVPTRRFSKVDLPTFGAPRMAMKPQRVGLDGFSVMPLRSELRRASSCSAAACSAARLEPPVASPKRDRRARPRSRTWARARAGGPGHAVLGQAEPAALRPLLQGGLGVTRRADHGFQARLDAAAHDGGRRLPAAVEVDGAHQPRGHPPGFPGRSRPPASSSLRATSSQAPRPSSRAASASAGSPPARTGGTSGCLPTRPDNGGRDRHATDLPGTPAARWCAAAAPSTGSRCHGSAPRATDAAP